MAYLGLHTHTLPETAIKQNAPTIYIPKIVKAPALTRIVKDRVLNKKNKLIQRQTIKKAL